MDFAEQLAEGLKGLVVVIGMGNPLRGDDGAGSAAARLISGAPGAWVVDAQDIPEAYMAQTIMQRPDTVVLIDAVDLGRAPGSVAFLERHQLNEYWPTTHRVPAALLMKILEEQTHARVFTIGIQPAHTQPFEPMSPEVSASVERIADLLNAALARGASVPPLEKEARL